MNFEINLFDCDERNVARTKIPLQNEASFKRNRFSWLLQLVAARHRGQRRRRCRMLVDLFDLPQRLTHRHAIKIASLSDLAKVLFYILD